MVRKSLMGIIAAGALMAPSEADGFLGDCTEKEEILLASYHDSVDGERLWTPRLTKTYNICHPEDSTYLMRVKDGDTVSHLTNLLNHETGLDVTWQTLARYNDLRNPDVIIPGQVLIYSKN